MNLPFLPGHKFSDPYKQNYHKNQVFELKSATCTEKPDFSSVKIDPFTISGLSSLTSTVTADRLKNRETKLNESYPRILPQWIKHDKNVLKFYSYFVEHVIESAYENYRIRKCNIFYYLDDDSIHITELKEENSGLPQGYFVKRHRIEKEESKGEYISWKDFNLKSEIYLYGKKFRICDCDDFTKNYYSEKGVVLNEAEAIPEVDFEDKFKKIDKNQNLENIAELKEYIEVKLGGGHPNKTVKQFLENDRKVLNFDIVWFDDKYDKEEKRYKMNFYLADGMIEVREIKVSNSGKAPFPLLLRKSKLAKKPNFSYCPGLNMKKEEFYQPKDLILGNYVEIYNRSCLITDCDDFTKKWYKQNLGIDLLPFKVKRNPPQKVIHPIPPHNGFGSEEDSLLSVYFLRPEAKIKDMNKMFKSDKHILRFNAKLISSIPSDAERKFIVSVFARDDTLQIYEVADKNSGRISSKFIERNKQKNPYTNKYYSEKDFVVGNTIYINKYIFKLLECDDYTKKYMKDNAELFRDSDVSFVVDRVKVAGLKYQNYEDFVIEILKTLDPNGANYITKEEISEGFKKMNLYLSTQELNTLTDVLQKNENGLFSLEDLFNILINS